MVKEIGQSPAPAFATARSVIIPAHKGTRGRGQEVGPRVTLTSAPPSRLGQR
jgi:hypothetical protein